MIWILDMSVNTSTDTARSWTRRKRWKRIFWRNSSSRNGFLRVRSRSLINRIRLLIIGCAVDSLRYLINLTPRMKGRSLPKTSIWKTSHRILYSFSNRSLLKWRRTTNVWIARNSSKVPWRWWVLWLSNKGTRSSTWLRNQILPRNPSLSQRFLKIRGGLLIPCTGPWTRWADSKWCRGNSKRKCRAFRRSTKSKRRNNVPSLQISRRQNLSQGRAACHTVDTSPAEVAKGTGSAHWGLREQGRTATRKWSWWACRAYQTWRVAKPSNMTKPQTNSTWKTKSTSQIGSTWKGSKRSSKPKLLLKVVRRATTPIGSTRRTSPRAVRWTAEPTTALAFGRAKMTSSLS